jgi:hypothetical protein
MESYGISTIKRLGKRGGLLINGNITVNDKYKMNIDTDSRRIEIISENSDDIYSGSIDEITFQGHKQPRDITDIIDWLKPGGIDTGGDSGLGTVIQFDDSVFSGDGSEAYPITLRKQYLTEVSHNETLLGKGTEDDKLAVVVGRGGVTPYELLQCFSQDLFAINQTTGLLELNICTAHKFTLEEETVRSKRKKNESPYNVGAIDPQDVLACFAENLFEYDNDGKLKLRYAKAKKYKLIQ